MTSDNSAADANSALDDTALDDMVAAILGDHERPPGPNEQTFDPELWNAVQRAGLTLLSIDENLGGSGGDLNDLAVVIRRLGYFGSAVPLVETAALAAPMLAAAGLPVTYGPMAATRISAERLTRTGTGYTVDGEIGPVPWAQAAERIVVVAGSRVLSIDPAACSMRQVPDLTGHPRAAVTVAGPVGEWAEAPTDLGLEFLLRGALSRCLLISGAAERALELTLDHAAARTQFGRPLGRFQAVQQLAAHAAAELCAGTTAAQTATATAAALGFAAGPTLTAIGSAKAQLSETAAIVAKTAHQIHGAIGITAEHPLGRYTQPMWAWRDEFGSDAYWWDRIGRCAISGGAAELWPLVAAAGPEVRSS